MNESQQLRESIWDLVYGLLSPEESEVLIVRIKSDPEAARLYSEVRLQADLVGHAARVEDSSVVVTLDGASKPAPAKRSQRVKRPTAESNHSGAWLAGISAMALAALLLLGFFWPQPNVQQLAEGLVSIEVSGQQPISAGLTSQVAVRTTRATGGQELTEGMPAALELRLLDRSGNERYRQTVQTSELGKAQVELPGSALEPGVRLEVGAAEKLGRTDIAESSSKNSPAQTALATELPVQPEPQLAYFLLAEPKLEAEKQVPFSVWSFSAFSAKPSPPETAQAALESVEGLAHDKSKELAKEGQITGTLQFAAGEKADPRSFAFGNRMDWDSNSKGAQAKAEIAAGQPIALDVPPELAGKEIAVAAVCRGVTVNTSSQLANSGHISLPLPPEADGLIEVNWFDRSTSETEPVKREVVYRQPLRKIEIELPQLQERFAPGQEVALSLRCTDETGKPAADTRLGIRVWNERAIQESGEQPLLLADAVRGVATETLGDVVGKGQGGQLAQRGLAEAYRKRLSDESLSATAASAAIGDPVALATNHEQVNSEIHAAYARTEANRQRAIQIIGAAAMLGGIAVLLLMGILALLRMTAGFQTMSPALVAALASLFMGFIWFGSQPQPQMGQIAMAPMAAESQHPADAAHADSDNEALSAPALPAIVPGEKPTVESRLSDNVPAATAPTADKPLGGPAASETLKRNAALAEGAFAPARAPQEPANSQPVRLQREEQKANLTDQRAAAGRGGAGGFSASGMNAGRASIASGSAAKARPLPAPQLSANAPINELRSGPAALAGASPPGAAGAAAAKSEASTAPNSLYFNPQLMTDAEGRATIRFVMPQAASEYRLLIDALGQGRIGSRQQLIVCGSPETAK